ncbi:MAG TPA: DUF465 domain-containing protein [Deltaproteobacteria bacterium]|nr:DUF465 domain-containing protein [Deltaproteobacteria bacterium]
MPFDDDENVEKLLGENTRFKEAYEAHRNYDRKIAELEKKHFLSADEEMEKNRLKKLKLAMKDRMEQMLSEYKARA